MHALETLAAQYGPLSLIIAFGVMLFAGFTTDETPDAVDTVVHQLQALLLSLGIGAPPAVQRTALEKNESSNAWSVVSGEVLDVEDESFGRLAHSSCSVRSIT